MKTEKKQKIPWFSPLLPHPTLGQICSPWIQTGNSLILKKKSWVGKGVPRGAGCGKNGEREMEEDEIQNLLWNSLLAFPGNAKPSWKSSFSRKSSSPVEIPVQLGEEWWESDSEKTGKEIDFNFKKCGKYWSNSKIPGNEGVEFCWELLKGNSLEIPHSGIRQHREYLNIPIFPAQLNFSPSSPWSWRDSKASSPNYKIPMKFCPFHTFMPL